jgi:hypothetical protein
MQNGKISTFDGQSPELRLIWLKKIRQKIDNVKTHWSERSSLPSKPAVGRQDPLQGTVKNGRLASKPAAHRRMSSIRF